MKHHPIKKERKGRRKAGRSGREYGRERGGTAGAEQQKTASIFYQF
jgi:hypothetical protein